MYILPLRAAPLALAVALAFANTPLRAKHGHWSSDHAPRIQYR